MNLPSCSTVVEDMLYGPEVMGSYPAGCYAFFYFLSLPSLIECPLSDPSRRCISNCDMKGYKKNAIMKNVALLLLQLRKRIKTEAKAKVIAAVWGTEFI